MSSLAPFTFTPSERAVLSSSASRLHFEQTSSENTSHTAEYTASVRKSSQVFMVMLAFTMLAAPE